MARLDRFFVNQAWLLLFPISITYSYPRIMSDHSPIYLDNGISFLSQTPQFKFEVFFAQSRQFH
jgi:hypothetical protein